MNLKIALIALTALCAFELGQNVDVASGQLIIDWSDGAMALAKFFLAVFVAWQTIFASKS